MKAEDLMIGDFIQHKITGETLQVTEILSWGVKVKEHDDAVADSMDILPIPLTQEILFKNGWIYLGDYWDIEIDEGFMLEIGVDGMNRYWWIVGTMLICPINYVHELQHALRLRGIEKEIEL